VTDTSLWAAPTHAHTLMMSMLLMQRHAGCTDDWLR